MGEGPLIYAHKIFNGNYTVALFGKIQPKGSSLYSIRQRPVGNYELWNRDIFGRMERNFGGDRGSNGEIARNKYKKNLRTNNPMPIYKIGHVRIILR